MLVSREEKSVGGAARRAAEKPQRRRAADGASIGMVLRDDSAGRIERAQTLNPDDWNYHRQEWSFTGDADKNWLEKFKKTDERYYPKLKLKPEG